MPAPSPIRKALYGAILGSATLLILFAISEFTLYRIGARLYPYPWPDPKSREETQDEIWCLGDSWTQGAGAPPGLSYPSQLQALLQSQGRPWKVRNLGYGGSNSSEQLMHLSQALKQGRPKCLIYLGGMNNGNSLVAVDFKVLWDDYGVLGLARSFLERSRTYRLLFNYLIPELKSRLLHGKDAQFLSAYPVETLDLSLGRGHEEKVIRLLRAQKALSVEERLVLGCAYFACRRYPEAAAELDRARASGRYLKTSVPIDLIGMEALRLAGNGVPDPEVASFYGRPFPFSNNDTVLTYSLGKIWVLIGQGRMAQAREIADGLSKEIRQYSWKPPDAFLFAEASGWSYLLESDEKTALRYFTPILSLKPAEKFFFPVWTYLGAAWIYADQGNFRKCGQCLSAVKRFYPESDRRNYEDIWAWIEMIGSYRRIREGLAPLPGVPNRLPALRTRAELRKLRPRLLDLPRETFLHYRPMYLPLYSYDRKRALRVLEQDIDEIRRFSSRDGFQLIVAGYPNKYVQDAGASVRRFCDGLGIPYADLYSAMGDIWDRRLYGADATHPDERGYREMARILSAYVVRAMTGEARSR